MKTQFQSLTFAALMAGALILPRTALAGGVDHAVLAAKYTKLAATQQALIDETLKLKAQNLAPRINPKAFSASRVAQVDRGYDAMIDASAKEKAELERYAKWHQLEASGAGSKVASLIAEQNAVIAESQKARSEARSSFINEKATPSSRYATTDKLYDGKIVVASAELADLQGYAKWHKLASTSAATEIAKLTSEQEALVAEHSKMKMENQASFRYVKAAAGQVAQMNRHCDQLIADASRELSVLKEFAQN